MKIKRMMKMLMEKFIKKILNDYKPNEKEVIQFKYYTMVIYPK